MDSVCTIREIVERSFKLATDCKIVEERISS